jgi:hypothetical protein
MDKYYMMIKFKNFLKEKGWFEDTNASTIANQRIAQQTAADIVMANKNDKQVKFGDTPPVKVAQLLKKAQVKPTVAANVGQMLQKPDDGSNNN